MALIGLRDQHKLDGASNFGWKDIILLLLENGFKEYATSVIVIPTDLTLPSVYKEDAKARRIIVDGVKDHILPHIIELNTRKKMCNTVMNLYQNATTNRKLILWEKLRNMKMNKGQSVVIYITKFRVARDEFVVVGDKPDDDELLRIAINGFSKQWDVFAQVINVQDTLSSWDRLGTISLRRRLY